MASTDVNPPVYRGRFTTKGVGRLPRRDVSVSPRSPITHCSNTSRHQGAFALFIFGSLSLSLSLSSVSLLLQQWTVKKWAARGCKKKNAANNRLIGLLALTYRSIRGAQLLRAQLEQEAWRLKQRFGRGGEKKKGFLIAMCLCKTTNRYWQRQKAWRRELREHRRHKWARCGKQAMPWNNTRSSTVNFRYFIYINGHIKMP